MYVCLYPPRLVRNDLCCRTHTNIQIMKKEIIKKIIIKEKFVCFQRFVPQSKNAVKIILFENLLQSMSGSSVSQALAHLHNFRATLEFHEEFKK